PHRKGGGGGLGGQGGGQLAVDLRHREPAAHGGVLVHHQPQLGRAFLLAVGGLFQPLHAPEDVHQIVGDAVEFVHVRAADDELHAAAAQHRHVHAGGGHAHLAAGHLGGKGGKVVGGLFA